MSLNAPNRQVLATLLDRIGNDPKVGAECDGMTRIVQYYLAMFEVEHTIMAGKLVNYKSGHDVAPHFWIYVPANRWEPDGLIIDYRARMWCGDEQDVPHGVFAARDFPRFRHVGQPTQWPLLPGQIISLMLGTLFTEERPIPATLNYPFSRDLGLKIECRPRECWRNAVLASIPLELLAPGLGWSDVVYVEGWVVNETGLVVPIEHGWLQATTKTGETVVVDTTLAVHWPEDARPVYFPGKVWDLDSVAGAIDHGQSLPLVYQGNGWGGFKDQGYKQAYDAALAYMLAGREPDA